MLKRNIKVIITSLLIMASGISAGFIGNPSAAYADSNIAKGADIGWLNQLENKGIKWQNDYGYEQDPIQILKDKGIDSIRLRVFVNPPSSFEWTKRDGTTCYLGYGDKTGVVYMAQRAKSLGMKVLIDFHYSDHFADPAYQDKPEAWKNHNLSQLQDDVYNHTYDVMSALANVGVYPDWVQVGNETNSGMMWPDGSSSNYNDWSKLINKGYDAVKNVSPSSKVILHLSNGYDNSLYRSVFDGLTNAGAKYDVIGMSYYPYWNGVDYSDNVDDLSYNLNDMASRYGKEVMIAEVGGLESDPVQSFNIIKAAIDKVRTVPNNKGIGVFYWEPEANSNVLPDKYPLGATSMVSGNTLKFTSALDAFKENTPYLDTNAVYQIVNRNSCKSLNICGGSTYEGAYAEQYTYGGWNSEQWQLISTGDGYYRIKNLNSWKVLDIANNSWDDYAHCIQWYDNNTWNQQWQIIDQGNGYFKIRNRNSGKLLTVNDSSTDNSATICQKYDTNDSSQMWSFVKIN